MHELINANRIFFGDRDDTYQNILTSSKQVVGKVRLLHQNKTYFIKSRNECVKMYIKTRGFKEPNDAGDIIGDFLKDFLF